MTTARPKVVHTYQNHVLDSTRWNHYTPRATDVIVATPYKSGTTLTLNLVRRLIFLGQEAPPYNELWIDARFRPIEELMAELDAQQHRRYIKTHLALDGLPFFPQVSYIVVGRDVRDVFMSFWNHYANFTPELMAVVNALPDRVGGPFPTCPEDVHEVWHDWITRGWFPWEREGYPWWGNMHHVQSWWDYRHLDNVLFVHFNDLLANLPAEIKRIAAFLYIEVPDESLATLADSLSLEAMRREAEKDRPDMAVTWVEGAKTFFFRGTNGRWKDVLSAEELALYEETASRELTPECRAWLEQTSVTRTSRAT